MWVCISMRNSFEPKDENWRATLGDGIDADEEIESPEEQEQYARWLRVADGAIVAVSDL